MMSVYDSRRPTARYSLPQPQRRRTQSKPSNSSVSHPRNDNENNHSYRSELPIMNTEKSIEKEEKIAIQTTEQKKQNRNLRNTFQLSSLKLDNDKLIILALMVILIKEGADMKLIAALAYILL